MSRIKYLDAAPQGTPASHTCSDTCKHNKKKWDLGHSLELFISQDSTNKLDSREQLIDGVELNNYQPFKEVFHRSRWRRLRKRLGKLLSLQGKAAVSIEIVDDIPYLELNQVHSYRMIGNRLLEFWGTTDIMHEYDNNLYPVYTKWYFKEGGVYKEYTYKTKDSGWLLYADPIHLKDIDYIPVGMFFNNEDGLSDIDNTAMWDAINTLNYHTNEITKEWDMSKTTFAVNAMYNPSYGVKNMEDEKADNRMIISKSPDGQLQSAIAPLIGGTQNMLYSQSNINFVEDKILKYTFTVRDSTATGTNKQTSEIAQFNAVALEYLVDKREIREEDYKHFYNVLSKFLGLDKVEKVEILVSELVENLIENSKPVEQLRAQYDTLETAVKEEN